MKRITASTADCPGADVSAPSRELRTIADFNRAEFHGRDLFARCGMFRDFADKFRQTASFSFYSVRHASKGVEVTLSLARRPEPRSYISFAGYDYLGLSCHPDVIAAARTADDVYGASTTGSPPLSGRTVLHQELEETVAGLFHKQDAILFGSAFAANVGTLNALLRRNDVAVADVLAHASLQDGLSSSGAVARFFRHNDADHADVLLSRVRPTTGGALLITEGLFSMDGTVPNVVRFAEVARKHEARILIDEAHSFMTIGPTGLGALERHDAFDAADLVIGSLSKTPGANGGFVAGCREIIDWLRCFARPAMFSGGPSPSSVAAASEAIRIQRRSPSLLHRLRANIRRLSDGLAQFGCPLRHDPESPIVPVIIGDEAVVGLINETLLDAGIFTSPVIFPAVAINASRFRVTVTATHEDEQIDRFLSAFEKGMRAAAFHF